PRAYVVVVVHPAESLARSEEMHFGPPTLAGASRLERGDRHAVAELHLVHVAVAPDREAQPLRKSIDHGHADAMQPARDLVAVRVELAAGMQLGHDDLRRRAVQFVVA